MIQDRIFARVESASTIRFAGFSNVKKSADCLYSSAHENHVRAQTRSRAVGHNSPSFSSRSIETAVFVV